MKSTHNIRYIILFLIFIAVTVFVRTERINNYKKNSRFIDAVIENEDSFCGFYTLEYVDKNHVFGLVNDIKEGRSGDLQCFVTYQIDDLLSHPEKYTAVRVCIYLQNNTEYDVEGLQVLSYREKVYIENGYLICDVPLLPAKFSDYSHDETWIILESKDFSENSLNDLDLYIKGCIYTESREKSTVNVEFKIYCDNVK